MQFVTYRDLTDGVERAGVLDDGVVHALPGDPTMRETIALGLEAAQAQGDRALAAAGTPLADVRLVAPLQPASLRDCVAFEEHVEGVRRSIDGVAGVPPEWYDAPTFYFTNPHTVIGPQDDVAFPAASVARDFELEVAVVIGREGCSVAAADAADHVFGYTLLNDWSARDLQAREMKVGLGPAKGKDFANTLGPAIVTPDELAPWRDGAGFLYLWCTAAVNGVEIGHDLLSNMGWTFESMIVHASRDSRIVPGDLIGSGTTGNGGCLAELWGRRGRQDPPPLRDGDVVTIRVSGLGSLTTRITSAAPRPDGPLVRRRDAAAARAEHALQETKPVGHRLPTAH